MHTNWYIFIEISIEIRRINFWVAINESCVTLGEFHFSDKKHFALIKNNFDRSKLISKTCKFPIDVWKYKITLGTLEPTRTILSNIERSEQFLKNFLTCYLRFLQIQTSYVGTIKVTNGIMEQIIGMYFSKVFLDLNFFSHLVRTFFETKYQKTTYPIDIFLV